MSNINRKLRTRKALMNSALELVGEGQHFSSLSLREVAKRAGVVPNAFYRHFKNLDELGLTLADEVGLLLRQLMRQARLQGLAADRMISDSVDFFISNVMENRSLFRFMSQSLTGGSESLRAATRNELSFFAAELVMDLNRLRILTQIEAIDLDMLGHLVVQTVSGITSEILDVPPESENLVNAIRQRTIKQIRLIFLGAGVWHSIEEHKSKHKHKQDPSDSRHNEEISQTVAAAAASAALIEQEVVEVGGAVSEARPPAKATKAAASAKAKSDGRAKKAAKAKAKAAARSEKAAESRAKVKAKAKTREEARRKKKAASASREGFETT